MPWSLHIGDAQTQLTRMRAKSVHTCITSPPYFGLRDYGVDGQIGLERTPEEFVAKLVGVFEEVRRVIRSDGTLWIVIGDSYAARGGDHSQYAAKNQRGVGARRVHADGGGDHGVRHPPKGTKPKDLIGIPWMLAFALRDAGWYLRQEIIWAKGISGPTYRGGSCMPESMKDRCTRSHETILMLSKSHRYYYDQKAIREPCTEDMQRRAASGYTRGPGGKVDTSRHDATTLRGEHAKKLDVSGGRNRRSVWHVNPRSFRGAHFATFPPDLIEPMVLAGCAQGGVVLDPFAGSGTTGIVAIKHNRSFVGIELNPEYAKMARERLRRAWAERAQV